MSAKQAKVHGGWAVDGVEYSNMRLAAKAAGLPAQTFRNWCARLGRRRVTSAEVGALSYTPHGSGNAAWASLSGTENTGAGREAGAAEMRW